MSAGVTQEEVQSSDQQKTLERAAQDMVIDHLTWGMTRLEALHAIQENPDNDADESDLNLGGAANIGSARSIPDLGIGSDKAVSGVVLQGL